MRPLLLSEIIAAVGGVCATAADVTVSGVSTDTRTLKAGELFIALSGDNFNGHDYIGVAEECGAAAAICSEQVETNLPVIYVENTLQALQALAAYYRSTLNIKVVGVTGSNGKTTTRNLIAAVLSARYRVYSTKKNYNNEIGLPKSVLELDDTVEIAVLEMGMNHLGEIETLTQIAKPDVAVITNIGKAHIGNLGSQENILRAKLEILKGLAPNGILICNGDDKLLRTAETGNVEKYFVGMDMQQPLSVAAKALRFSDTETHFTLVADDKETRGSIPLTGAYNVANFLEAVCCGRRFGISAEEALQAVQQYQSEAMRAEMTKVNGVRLIQDCYNASPDSMRVALETLHTLPAGRRYAVLGEMLELGDYSAHEHKILGAQCAALPIDTVIFIGDDAPAIQEGCPSAVCFSAAEREAFLAAVQELATTLQAEDCVLIKGSRGMKLEQAYAVLQETLQAPH